MSTILLDTFTSADAASINGRAPESSTGAGTWNDGYLIGIVSNKLAWTGTGNPSAGGYAGIGIGANPYGYDAASPSTATAAVDFTLTSTSDFTYGRRGVSCGFGSTNSIGTNKYISVKFSSPIESSQWYMTIAVSDLSDSTYAVSLSGGTPYSVQIEFSPSGAVVLFQGTPYTVSSDLSGFRVGNLSLDDIGNGCSIESVLVTDVNIDMPEGVITTDITFSKITFASSGTVGGAPSQMTISLPSITVTAQGHDSTGEQAFDFSLPSLTVRASGGVVSNFSLPPFAVLARAHNSTGEQAADITLPSLSVAVATGANSKLNLPSLSLDAAMTVTNLASAPITLPGLSVASDTTVSGMADAAISLPSMSAIAYSGALCSVTIGSLTVQATGTTGSVASAQVTLPLMQATGQATANGYGSAAITLPSLSVGSSSRAALTLPGLKLTAIGTATITATYEAYAVNLKHSDPDAIDETTRYTNFPFTHVVRYKNSYYGANSTGLYLLEGTTDDGAAIPFDVKTAMTDFKSPMRKTLASAYFSGRFGPASTITLTAGEGTPVAYSFSTPRGQAAQNHRQVFGKGLKDRYFALEVAGTGTLELDGIEMDVAKLSRRI